jgi:CO/xanthine dehydrogenase FAD-binding subunit
VTQSFEYHRPASLAEALALKKSTPDARFIAGGTDLMVRLREGTPRPPALISLRGVEALSGIELGSPIRFGALTPVADVLEHRALGEAHPVFAQAARTLGSTQIRNAATVGGNLVNASPCADMAQPLLVHDAQVVIAAADSKRRMPLEDFFVAPGETRLGPEEVLTAIEVDPPPAGSRAVFFKKGRVRMDIAVASVCVLLHVVDGRCALARVSAGSVAPRPIRLHRVEALLEGERIDEALVARAQSEAEAEVTPITDVRGTSEYRRHIVGAFVARALRALAGDTDGGGS